MNDEARTDTDACTGLELFCLEAVAGLLALFICALFTVVGGVVLCAAYAGQGFGEGAWFTAKLALKIVLSGGIAVASGWGLLRLSPLLAQPAAPTGNAPSAIGAKSASAFCLALLFVAALVVPRLNEYPWAAPDETHHLIVARNLAKHGLYASGHPDTGLIMFDNYDSVGAPAIVPVAGALRLAGPTLRPARLVMAAYYLWLCVAVYLLFAPVLGGTGTVAGILIMTVGFGSVYLARTLYGEVPSLAFLMTGLLLWRRAINSARPLAWGLPAGVMFGLMVLCKSISVLVGFAFLGALVFDFLSHRRIRWTHLVGPAVGGVLVIAAWWMIKELAQHEVRDTVSGTLNLYKHYLLFGFRCVRAGLVWMLREPFSLAGLACAMAWIVPVIFSKRYDPPSVVMFLLALFFTFWYLFFTPGRLPRYLWYSYATAGVFAGAMAWAALRATLAGKTGPFKRILCAGIVVLVVTPAVIHTGQTVRAVWTVDEMSDEYEVARFVSALPKEKVIATTYWPLERTINFLTHRSITTVDAIEAPLGPDVVVIVEATVQPELLEGRVPTLTMGRYAILAAEE